MIHWTVKISTILLISCVEIGAYNLDTTSAILFSDPNAGFYRKGSYFGYSVALYANPADPLVIIGAPRANISRLLGIREPGAVYYCRLTGYCKEWPLDSSRNGELHGIEGINQMLDESWIGATISVENKSQPRVVVCAPRWKNILWGAPFMNGICYYTVANSSSAFQKPVQKFITELAFPRRQVTDGEFRYNYFAMGELGFSIHQFSDEPIWDAMVGAPGCYAWTGTPVMISENKPGRLSSLISEKFDENTQLSGYSVTSGFYFDDKRRWYVASAPQTNDLKGKIEIFQYDGNHPFRGVKIVTGTQSGEYFGASLTSCDVDNDGRDDLIVGAPSWSMNGDEGRIYVISARRNGNGFDRTSIDGKFEGGRFGSSVVCLGDLDHDGYGDVAVGAPYEDKSGAVYIFNGGRYGLITEPSQKILGKDFGRLSGFGIAISEPRDVDGNGYPDIAVGAYRSGHAVLFRAQSVVEVKISLNYVESARLNSNTTKFSVRSCGYYDGHRAPDTLRVKRIFRLDEAHHRARLDTLSGKNGDYEFEGLLRYGREICTDIPIILTDGTKTNPIDISASVTLMDTSVTLNKYRSKIEDTVRLPFDVDCGSDNVCLSNLTLHVSTSLGKGNRYIIGGEKTVKVSIDVENHGEAAYETQVHVTLPDFLSLASLPASCEETHLINGSVEVVCGIGNPLRLQTTLVLELSMSQVEVESEHYSSSIQVPIHLTTQSTNVNHERGSDNLVINLAMEANVDITGKAEQSIYSYLNPSGDTKLDVIQFNHIYGVQKLGITPIQQAILIVLVPTHLRKSENEIIEIAKINATTLKFFDSTNRNDNDYVCKMERIGVNEKKIITKESSNFTHSVDASLRNRALFLNCDNDAIDCVNVTCLMDVPKESVTPSAIAELQLTIDLLLRDIPDDITASKDIIYFVSKGSVMITHPSQVSETSEMGAKSTLVVTKFLETAAAAQVTIWIIVVSVLVGILLLALLIFALIKLGFFNRKHKEELEALKADSDENNEVPLETTSSKQWFLFKDIQINLHVNVFSNSILFYMYIFCIFLHIPHHFVTLNSLNGTFIRLSLTLSLFPSFRRMLRFRGNFSWFFALIFVIFWGKSWGYNIDIKGTVVFSDPGRGNDNRKSYFGYAVALYPSSSDPVVLVGAPRANVSRLGRIQEPGAVYHCHFDGTCKEWVLSEARNGRVKGLTDVNQRLDGAWIGAAISVENNTTPGVVVCAPQWKNVIAKYYYENGLCYYTVANNSRAFQRTVDSIVNVFAGRNDQVAFDDRGESYNLRAMGMMGFSVYEFTDEQGKHWVTTGAPGYHESAGNIVLFSRNENGRIESVVPKDVEGAGEAVIGYSVTSGFYFDANRKERWYVASAPRTKDVMGSVLIFRFNGNKSVKKPMIIRGGQVGEYFGASVTSCDVDNDGRDNLIVGAPSWSRNGDEGRIYVISARRNSNGFDRTSIDGKFEGVRFGSSVVCLGDLDHDGYGDVAVGAPYEDESGAVYIFNGGRYGLSTEPSQKILGRDLGSLRGFGMAISEPRDVDGNGYPDIAVGAYRSGHAVLFRAQPVVKVNISLNSVDSTKLNSSTTNFFIRFCGYYDGQSVPETMRVMRIFKLDETLHRARLATHSITNGTYDLEDVLRYNTKMCNDIPIILERGMKTKPLDISVSLTLMNEEPASGFCKRCPIINRKISITEASLRVNFDLDCGPDNICHSNLTSKVSTSLGDSNNYIMGREKIVKVSIDIRNYGEPAYEAKAHVLLSEFIALSSIPSTPFADCKETPVVNGSVELVCALGNPFRQQTTLTLELDMSQLKTESELYTDSISVPTRLSTESINDNDENEINNLIIHLVIDSALNITGQAKDSYYSYFSTSEDNKIDFIQFDHIYGVQKLGITPIQQAILIILVPTHFRKSKNEIIEIAKINATTLKFFDSTNPNDNDYVCKVEKIGVNEKKIITGELSNFTKSVDASLRKRALFLTCDNNEIDCVNVTCSMDVPKESANSSLIAELKLTIDLLLRDVTDDFAASKDIIYFVSNGSVMITHPSRASETSGMGANSTLISTQFLGTPVAAPVATWVIASSVVVGIVLLALVIFALVKLGFFRRRQKEALEALMADSDVNRHKHLPTVEIWG
ncbi:uncharacterized protein LOC135162618 [Diachasmimorpha longicaudata]|uniref:uncharacterized protein LOC135162618 n=1 Tax=Diachasmimorpha longicaudata TaxID=58733 RepID=UPI0030B878D8